MSRPYEISQERINLLSTYDSIRFTLDQYQDWDFIYDIFAEFAVIRNMPWYNRTIVRIFGPTYDINALTPLEEAALLYTLATLKPPGSHVLLFTL
ncbi:MAG: hypothetical protein P0S94_04375 [Simkaniaceae bacterium]|nr:hypothetical protein [Simkaniaceae bacterium]